MDEKVWEKISADVSKNTLKELHGIISNLLAEEDKSGGVKEFGVREYQDWKKQADIFENALKERGFDYNPIQW
jgi:hypothetical protein